VRSLRLDMITERFQVLVVGSGFGGSLMAMVALRLGFSTGLVERGKHPRFVIGESTTPLTNLLLEEIATEFELPGVRPLCKWGTWQQHAPQLACGLKRGFTFYHHSFDQPFKSDPAGQKQLLVGASPRDEVADTHWYRPEFDQYLVQQAQGLGVSYWDEVALSEATELPNGMRLAGTRQGERVEFTADLVIDASGARGFLHRLLGLREKSFTTSPPTQALFSHFTGVGPLPDSFTLPGRASPYPPENAAVHHIFPGGWIWVLKFNNGVTSAGVAATDAVAEALDFASGGSAWKRLLGRLPSLQSIFSPARSVVPFVYQPRLAFQSDHVAGPNWILLPSAAGVIDPLLSTGFPLTLLGIQRIGRILGTHWQQSSFPKAVDEYAALTALELETTGSLVGALYSTMDRFDLFKSLSLLYFAAASFSEVSRRLRKSHLADSFLLSRDPDFAPQLHQLCELARQARPGCEITELKRRIMNAIAPFDLAGLTDSSRDPFYPALGEDILRNAGKLHATREELATLFRADQTK
jgi:FADH2 O2-dependent halogenase